MLFLVTRPARERDCPPRTGDEEPRHPRTMGPSPLPVMLAEPTGPGAAGKVPGRMDSHGGHRTGSVPSGAAGATKPLPSGLYRIARIAPKRAGGGLGPDQNWMGPLSASLRASSVDVKSLRRRGRSNSCIISVSRGTCSRRRKVSRTSFARTIVSARSGGNWRGSSAGGEIDQAESARFRQDENRSESRNSGLRVEKRGLKRPGGPAFQDSGPPAWTFCCGSDRYCSGSHSQKPCIPTAFAGQGSWVTSASSHRCRPLLNPSVRVIGLRTSSVGDVMRLRAVTLASPHSGTAPIAVLQRQCQRGHPRPGSSWSALTCSLATANSASGDGPASTG